ncbi:hypothetical protein [Staphylococcus delphini]|uniref:Uncharacterized protein n=1 Tax=Staphylococcus delphini TaxID=53344 RepID=A0AAX0QX99_9STAP|nr:hypothetical protein [Staphylococcus delphini]PCF52116.1 hypothetical protein B5C07_01355 [Staphylococcus delphini]PNZ96392.1 hypothetical protein CD148_00960 [Staphylococcus delphini]RIZ54850.1 hypothetical protein CDL68_03825 [Staphylococcus delphini]VED63349.1 Uncharacterised protein [Staphylococcus delphini]
MDDLRSYLIENQILFNVFLDEPGYQFIYSDVNLKEEVGTVEAFNHKVYQVLSTRTMEGQLYGYLKGQREIGWVKLKNSHYVFNKQNEIVFVKKYAEIQNALNITYQFADRFTQDVQNKYLTSTGLVKYNDEFYELLFQKKRFVGFMKPSDLDVGYHVNENVNLRQGTVLFLESRLKTKAENVHVKGDFRLKLLFPEKGIGKLEEEKQVYWIELKHVDPQQLERILDTLPDYSSTEEVEKSDLIHNFLTERQQAKHVITALVNDKMNQGWNAQVDGFEGQSNIHERYQNLKNSKLGQLQIKYWNMRKKWGKSHGKSTSN